jgi:Xaa-Pro aminopeptidase
MIQLPTAEVASACLARRAAVSAGVGGAAFLLGAGLPRVRHYAANPFRFRAHSHFLYLTGASLPGAYLLVEGARATLFVERPAADDALWHGASPGVAALEAALGLEVARVDALPAALAGRSVASLPLPDRGSDEALAALLGRRLAPRALEGQDAALAEALIKARLCHDAAAIAEIRAAAAITASAFEAGMRGTREGELEWVVRAEMERAIIARGVTHAYEPIVSTRGEVLHNHAHDHTMLAGDLLLADFGAESPGFWASDVTRAWPVSARFSPTQRALYEVVLGAQRAAIAAVAPGIRYRAVHMAAARALTEGLVALGILRGDVDELVHDGVHALFFPHGVGHLLGLDVHDMEDLGDRAGYAPGLTRATDFGLCYLRLDRALTPGMVVTIEPGFYQVPAILEDSDLCARAKGRLDRAALARFADVRGIRLEDDVLVTPTGRENLTQAIPIDPDAVEARRA